MSNVACVFSGKGGVGKTTFLLSLAGTISNLRKKVLIVDTDLYNGGIAVALNKNDGKTIYHYFRDFDKGIFPNVKNYVSQYNNYIDIISAPRNLEEASKITFDAIDNLINNANLLYDVVLFDTNHVYNEFNDLLFKRMNRIFYMFTNDTLDLKNSKNNLYKLRKINSNVDLILNSSIHLNREYYIYYDIKNIVGGNIDYTISSRFHYDLIDNLTVNGQIITIYTQKLYDYKTFTLIAKSLIGG